MNAIRIRKKIDSDTLHIPELQSMMGQEVEIVVQQASPNSVDQVDPQAFWTSKTVDQLAAEQGVGPFSFDDPRRVVFTEEEFEGFDEALEQWRKEK